MQLARFLTQSGGARPRSLACRHCLYKPVRAKITARQVRQTHSVPPAECQDSSQSYNISRLLQERIRVGGPVTVADYMKFSLSHPSSGYYMKKDVLGYHGDFTTSPEISQMFGELIGIWCLNEWLGRGDECDVQIVELGPGKGTLADDIIRTWTQFEQTKHKLSIHLVEISDKMTELQMSKLCDVSVERDNSAAPPDGAHHKSGVSKHGVPVYWYRHLSQVPAQFSCYVAQEFFDALPIHKFQLADDRWCEVCVDYDTSSASFKHILSKSHQLWTKLFIKDHLVNGRTHLEVSPDGAAIAETMASRIAEHGGAAIIADYGHYGNKEDTFRGFKMHQLHDPLVEPGTADLTADVDFSYLNDAVSNIVSTHGPISQSVFLANMGINLRLKMLMQKADDETKRNLVSGFKMLMDSGEMGERFKFFALTPKTSTPYTPAGFTKSGDT